MCVAARTLPVQAPVCSHARYAAAVSLLYAGSRVFGKKEAPKTVSEKLPALHDLRAVKEIPAVKEEPEVKREKPSFAERLAHEKKRQANHSAQHMRFSMLMPVKYILMFFA
jgi:hypothetical protein